MLLPFYPFLVALVATMLAAIAVLAHVYLSLVGPPALGSLDVGVPVVDPGHLLWCHPPVARLRRCYEWCV